MMCKSCGSVQIKPTKSGLCSMCYSGKPIMEKLKFKVKEWKRFSWDQQMILTTKYEVILTDHRTKRELARDILINFPSYINKAIKIMDKGFLAFDKIMNQFDSSMGKSFGSGKGGKLDITGHKTSRKQKKKDYSFVTGKTSFQKYDPDYSFVTGKGKRKLKF